MKEFDYNIDYKNIMFTPNDTRYRIGRGEQGVLCLLYTSPSPRDLSTSRMPSSA